jgi:hypothetical protein
LKDWRRSARVAVHNVNLPAHVNMCETVIIDNIWPRCVGSHF